MSREKSKFEKYQFSLRFILDCVSIVLAWFLSYFLRFYVLPGAQKDSQLLFAGLSALAILSSLVFLFGFKMYEQKINSSRRLELEGIVKVSLCSFLTFVVVYYYLFDLKVSRIALAIYGLMLFTLLCLGRGMAHSMIDRQVQKGRFKQRALLYGYGPKLTSYYNAVANMEARRGSGT